VPIVTISAFIPAAPISHREGKQKRTAIRAFAVFI
jgi:hypothetical protein